MSEPASLIFILTYLGVALGRIPGLTLDRTGIALLGAIGMIVSGSVPLKSAMQAIDLPTIVLLYALMIISAQLRLGGFYTWIATKSITLLDRPRRFLFISMLLSGLLSALLANDIICLAFTPVLTFALIQARLNPLPFLLGLATASNIGSAATIIGNPQNMLIGQMGQLSFSHFLSWCLPPVLVTFFAAYGIICLLYRDGFMLTVPAATPVLQEQWPVFSLWQTAKGVLAVTVLTAFFFTGIARELAAITVAGCLLCSRKLRSKQIMELVDWHLITLFCALFIVVQGLITENIPTLIIEGLGQRGINPADYTNLAIISTVMSNLVSNVPASMLLIHFLDPAQPRQWYILALSSTFAGNLIIIGSIANLIVIEQAKKFGVDITFREHARIGVPVTLASLVILWCYAMLFGN